MEEHLRVIELTVEVVPSPREGFCRHRIQQHSRGDLPHPGGPGKRGADGLLIVTPYYNKPTQAGLVRPLLGTGAIHLAAPSLPTASPAARAWKWASTRWPRLLSSIRISLRSRRPAASIERFNQLRLALPEPVAILSGDDSMTLPAMAVGATGVISVASNLVPKQVVEMVRARSWPDVSRKPRRCIAGFIRSSAIFFIEGQPGSCEGRDGPPRLDDRRRAPSARSPCIPQNRARLETVSSATWTLDRHEFR